MGQFYRNIIRPLLFTLDPEEAHERGVAFLQALGNLEPLCRILESWNLTPPQTRPIELCGLHFPNCVGLAAGLDKDGRCWKAAAALGFGHVEIGTVTGQKQPGNDRPRVWRYPQEEALVNRMGFNNEGAEAMATRLKRAARDQHRRHPIPLGINIGKTKIVPLEKAVEDYLFSFQLLAPYADYFTVNVSSPNTPNLRQLQNRENLAALLHTLNEANQQRAHRLGCKLLPIMVKIAPDLTFAEVDEVISTILEHKISGVIATNTTIQRPGSLADRIRESGGMSGRPLHPLSVEMIKYIHRATEGRLPIIASGGIMDARTAAISMDAGASLIQIYTGFVYGGPFFAREIAHSLRFRHHSGWV